MMPPLSRGLLQMRPYGLEPGLINLLGDHLADAPRVVRFGREARFPVPEGAVAVGDRQQADMRHIVEHRDRRIEQAIGKGLLEIGEREQLLAQLRAVLQPEAAYAADLVGWLRPLDRRGGDRRMP